MMVFYSIREQELKQGPNPDTEVPSVEVKPDNTVALNTLLSCNMYFISAQLVSPLYSTMADVKHAETMNGTINFSPIVVVSFRCC